MKKLRLFCAIGALLMASTMNAKVGDTFTEGQFKYKVLSEEGITESGVTTVTGGTVSATNRVSGYDYFGDYVFPETVTHNGVEYVITTIGSNLFASVYNNPQNHDNMTSVTIPSTVKRIEGNAFSGNQTSKNSLRNVYLSEGLEFIGEGAFANCLIEEIDIPNSVTEIGGAIVYNCPSLKTIKIGKNLKTIGAIKYTSDDSQSYIYNEIVKSGNRGDQGDTPLLEEIIVDPENPYFCSHDGDMYSKDMTTLVMVGRHTKGDVIIPSSVNSIYNGVFMHTNITSLTIPEGITILPRQLCGTCSELTKVNIPENCKYIGQECFIYCTSLPRVELPAGVEIIDGSAFAYCESLREIKIPNSCTKIGYMAFKGCQQFTHVTLPSRLEYFGPSFLNGCKKITEITIPATFNFDLTKERSTPSVGVGNLNGSDTGGALKAIYIMGDSIPDAILYSRADWNKATIYVKKSVYNRLYPEGKVTKTIKYKSYGNQIVSQEVTCGSIGWMVPITMGDAENPDGVNYKTLCRDFDADFTDPEATDPECQPFYAADVNYERTWVAMQPMKYVPSRTLANVDGYEGVDAYHGVVIEGKPGRTYYYRIGENDYTLGAGGQTLPTARQEANMMQGANDDRWVELSETDKASGMELTNYGLKDNKFRIFTNEGFLTYNKSYLSLPPSIANAKSLSLAFFNGDGTTSIVSAESFAKSCDGGDVFNLGGQRVNGSYKGFAIKGGRKVFIR